MCGFTLGLVITGCQLTTPDLAKKEPTQNEGTMEQTYASPLLERSHPEPYRFTCGLSTNQIGPMVASVTEFGIAPADLQQAEAIQSGLLADEFKNNLVNLLQRSPANAECVAQQTSDALQQDSVAALIETAAQLAEMPGRQSDLDLDSTTEEVLARLCQGPCETNGELPEELAYTLAPLLRAIEAGLYSRAENVAGGTDWWQQYGGNGLLLSENEPGFNPSIQEYRKVLNADRSIQYQAAAQIAEAIEGIDWIEMAENFDLNFSALTPYGEIRISGHQDDIYNENTPAGLLLIDLGGNDIHFDQIASNRSGLNAVSIAIDVDGNDRYDLPTGEETKRIANNPNGPTASKHFTQGSAQYGIAMLFDLQGNDTYRSLRASQGYAHFGVGVLYDGNGDDYYTSEAASQGAAQFGIALAIDAGEGHDERFSFTQSQGFGYVSAVGILKDDGGDDVYNCDSGLKDIEGRVRYPSPQLTGRANTSMCQGAGLGLRANDKAISLSGGLGILHDQSGDDSYQASVYAQGAGYWHGTGLLIDEAGDDSYDAQYYAQGSGVHFANGVLVDFGHGNDTAGFLFENQGLSMGAGHDFGVGAFINAGGNDNYKVSRYSAGGTSCNGRGLFVEGDGEDTYHIEDRYSLGIGNAGECSEKRKGVQTIGIMIDAAGDDQYIQGSNKCKTLGNERAWSNSAHDLNEEIGLGFDFSADSATFDFNQAAQSAATR
ncbi:MAG: hypothetical protein VYC39_08750 [Myxococcota bacterium]|nr:hypothetical protein [Myxococcota bacterium]